MKLREAFSLISRAPLRISRPEEVSGAHLHLESPGFGNWFKSFWDRQPQSLRTSSTRKKVGATLARTCVYGAEFYHVQSNNCPARERIPLVRNEHCRTTCVTSPTNKRVHVQYPKEQCLDSVITDPWECV